MEFKIEVLINGGVVGTITRQKGKYVFTSYSYASELSADALDEVVCVMRFFEDTYPV